MKQTFPGGHYDKSKSVFDKIGDVYNYLLKKEKTYILYRNFNPVLSNNDDKYYSFECAFVFEAMLKQIKITDITKKLQIIPDHVPSSVYII